MERRILRDRSGTHPGTPAFPPAFRVIGIAKRVRPDVVTLAVMDAGSPALKAKVIRLVQQLAASDIAVSPMTLQPGDIEASPTLPTGTSYRVRLF